MTDIHCHILPLVDDGSSSFEDSLQMVKEHLSQEVTSIVLTPHFRKKSFEESDERVVSVFEDFCKRVKEEGLDVELRLGREITVYDRLLKDIQEGKFLALANGKFILLEFPYESEVDIEEICYNVKLLGHIPVIAHVERYSYFRKEENVSRVRNNGAVIQVNASAVVGKSYGAENKFVKKLLKKKLVDVVASDYHFSREDYIGLAYKKVKSKYGEEYANLIFERNPNYIISK